MKRGLEIDGLDADELLHAIKESFGVEIGDASIDWYTVGDIYEWLLTKLGSASGTKCTSAMCFYRLRRALIAMGASPPISPATPLAGLSGHAPKALILQLTNISQLRLPTAPIGKQGMFGLATLGVGVLMAIGVTAFKLESAAFGYAAAAALFVLGILGIRFDRGEVSKEWNTVGALANRIGALNFARLASEGARFRRDEVWNALTEITSEITGISKSEIGRDTYIVRPRPKKSA